MTRSEKTNEKRDVMTQWLLSFILGLSSVTAFASGADELPAGAIYYTGKQPVGIAGEEVDCYVEAAFSSDGSEVDLRALIADAHDSSVMIGKGTIEAIYSSAKGGYSFSTSESDAPVQEMLLATQTPKNAEGMELTFSDEGHLDTVSCHHLTEAKDTLLAELMEKFEHFDDFVEEDHSEDDHSDNHNH